MAHINDPSRHPPGQTSTLYSCHCGRPFTQPAGLKNHQNSYNIHKSHLLAAFKKAKEASAAQKLQKAAMQASGSQLGQTEHRGSSSDALNAQQASNLYIPGNLLLLQ